MNIQYINDEHGKALYALVPIAEFERLTADDEAYWEDIPVDGDELEGVTVPHEVVALMYDKDISIAAAWRIYRGLSQTEAAEKAGVTQSALSQMEKKGSRLQEKTRELLADVYGCDPAQLAE